MRKQFFGRNNSRTWFSNNYSVAIYTTLYCCHSFVCILTTANQSSSEYTTLTLQDHHHSHFLCVYVLFSTGLSLSSRAARRHLWDTPASNSTVQKPTGATAVLQQLPSNSDTTERAGRAHYYSSCYYSPWAWSILLPPSSFLVVMASQSRVLRCSTRGQLSWDQPYWINCSLDQLHGL